MDELYIGLRNECDDDLRSPRQARCRYRQRALDSIESLRAIRNSGTRPTVLNILLYDPRTCIRIAVLVVLH